MRYPCIEGELKALSIHIGNHQDVAGLDFCGDADDEARRVEGWGEGCAFLDVVLAAAGAEGRVAHGQSMEWFSVRVTPVRVIQ